MSTAPTVIRRPLAWLAALIVGCSGVAAHAAAPEPAATPAPKAVAITYFDNHSGDADVAPLARGLADMLITDLAQVSTVRIVERSRLNAVLAELTLSESPFVDPASAQRLGRGLAAQYILTGGFLVAGDTLRVDARLIEVETGVVAAGRKVEGKKSEFFAIEKELVDLLVGELKLTLSFSEKAQLRRNATESFDAWHHYSRGLFALDEGQPDEALAEFRAALLADPRYQAAKDATERLRVLIARDVEARDKATDKLVRELDPKSPDFGAQVDKVFQTLGQDPRGMTKRVVLLHWIVEHDYRPRAYNYSRAMVELAALMGQMMADPESLDLVAGVCEYIMTWYPSQPGAAQTCKSFLDTVDALNKVDREGRRNGWEMRMAKADDDWSLALRDNVERARELFTLCGKKARQAPPSEPAEAAPKGSTF
ncbi:MAG: hypothetical protein EP329_27610 [Deltaproteobacteria bacterium]|nr:MAG: hypothetical protein EP329_27610 [Deltaproteobacteria bacterium]